MTSSINKFLDLAKAHWSLLLILSAAFLFATKTSFNIPIYIMALVGLYRLVKFNHLKRTPELHFIYILFFCLWLPMLFSLIDAVDLPHSLKTTLPYLRFLFAAYFILDEVKNKKLHNKLMIGLGIIISFWCLDAFFQFFVGVDIFGYPMRSGSVGGLFSPKGTLSHVLAIFSPVCFEIVRRHHLRHKYLWLLLLIFFVVILLGGKRTAWMMFLSSCSIYCFYLFYLNRSTTLKIIILIAPVLALILGLFATQYQPLSTRIDKTMGLFSGNYNKINKATAMRLSIWETGLNIYAAHPINGIGPRGFRYAYADYSTSDNFWVKSRDGQTHPHLTILEIMVETGSIGVVGLLLFWLYLFRLSIQLIKRKKAFHLPWLMCIIIATLPYNSGSAFYGSYWSSVTWWIILVSACFIFSTHGENT